jgi:tetratricopeptide (TPR) repeat protein
MEILNRYAIDTAHICFAICVFVDGKSVAQSDLFYDVQSPDIKPLFIPLSQLPEGRAVCLKFLVLSDKLRIDASSLDDWKLVEGVGAQCSGVFQSNGSVIVEVRSKSRLTYMKYENQDKIDHAFTFHLQANEALADNQSERALALNLVALSWWQRHKMMHFVFCKVLIETGSLYFLHQNVDMAVAFIEAGLAYSHRLKLRSVDQQDGTNTDSIQNDSIADGLQELAMSRFYKGDYVRSISCLLEALHMKQQFYLEEELDDIMLDAAANKISLLYTQLLFIISEALSSGKQTLVVCVVCLALSSYQVIFIF